MEEIGGCMKSSFAIAYADKDGKDFNGIPWILDDLNNEEECLTKSIEMSQGGYVIPFQFEQKRRKNEEFDWDYVKKNKVVLK